MKEVRILFDPESKVITKVEKVGEISPLDAAKVLMSVAFSALGQIEVTEKKVKIVKPKIVGGK